jgi:general secretion pathway protein J
MSNIADCGFRISDFGSRSAGPGLIPHSAFRIPRSKGFTLLEVLLALTVLSVILATVYGSFATAGKNIERAEEVRDGTDRARTLLSRLTNDIANACLIGGIGETFLVGRKTEGVTDKQRFDSIHLTTLTNWRRPDSREMELWEVGYYFQERAGDEARILLRREKRELSKDVAPLEGGTDYELTDTVKGLLLRYADGTKWVDEWDTRKQGRLPRAVEIVLSLADGRVYATQVDIRIQ